MSDLPQRVSVMALVVEAVDAGARLAPAWRRRARSWALASGPISAGNWVPRLAATRVPCDMRRPRTSYRCWSVPRCYRWRTRRNLLICHRVRSFRGSPIRGAMSPPSPPSIGCYGKRISWPTGARNALRRNAANHAPCVRHSRTSCTLGTLPTVRLDVAGPRRIRGKQRLSMSGMQGVMNLTSFCYEKE